MSDDQLAEVIENIDIVTLTQINSEHDISFPSIISELMSPERIRDIVCQQPLYWEEKIKNNAEELVGRNICSQAHPKINLMKSVFQTG